MAMLSIVGLLSSRCTEFVDSSLWSLPAFSFTWLDGGGTKNVLVDVWLGYSFSTFSFVYFLFFLISLCKSKCYSFYRICVRIDIKKLFNTKIETICRV